MEYICTGCTERKVTCRSSIYLEGTQRSKVGLAIAVAFLTTGHTFNQYRKTLHSHLGVKCYSVNSYKDVMVMCAPHVDAILTDMMDKAKVSKIPPPLIFIPQYYTKWDK